MTITVELYQDTGPVSSGRGTTRTLVSAVTWRSDSSDASTSFIYAPLIRPFVAGSPVFNYSYTQYHFFKISGTYSGATFPKILLTGSLSFTPPDNLPGTKKGVRVYGKLTNTYAIPTNTFDGSLSLISAQDTLGTSLGGYTYLPIYPQLSTTGPEGSASFVKKLTANTTYYTPYLQTQFYTEAGGSSDYGNIGDLEVAMYLEEYLS